MTIGKRIKKRRIELGYTQDELAKKVGYKSRSSINKIELSRELPLNKVELMARALDTTPGYLMGWEEEDGSILNPIKLNELDEYQKAIGKFFYNDVLSSFDYKIDYFGGKYYLLSNCDENGEYHTRVHITESELDSLNSEIDNFIAFRVGQLYNKKRDTLESALMS